jgi:hypothetical protein
MIVANVAILSGLLKGILLSNHIGFVLAYTFETEVTAMDRRRLR